MEIHTHKRLNILFKNDFSQLLTVILSRINKEIKDMPTNLLFPANEIQTKNELIERNKLGDLPVIYWEQGKTKLSNIKIFAKDLPKGFDSGFSGTIERKKIDILFL